MTATVTMPSPTLLHRGPVATVYTGFHNGKPVALKVFPTRLDRRTLASVERSQSTLRTLGASAPILPVDGIDHWDDGRHALRMELCTESLTALVRRVGALAASDVVLLGHELSVALAAAHRAGILHGGVSPDNVLIRASGQPVLADFGVPLREAFPRDPLHNIECVSPQTLRTGLVDERTDLYGLGAVLHFALTGESPHPGRLGEQPANASCAYSPAPSPPSAAPTSPPNCPQWSLASSPPTPPTALTTPPGWSTSWPACSPPAQEFPPPSRPPPHPGRAHPVATSSPPAPSWLVW